MDDPGLFAMFGAALGLAPPWRVTSVTFDKDAGKLVVLLDFPRGSRFACPRDGCRNASCPVHDTVEKTWRHLDFFEHQAYLVARVPRVDCAQHGVHLVAVPWARPGSGFTVLMEVAMLTFAKQMPIAPLAVMAREHDTRIWRVIEHYVNATRADLDFSGVTQVGCDETSARRGQDYVSLFMDLAQRRVMFATPGRDAATVKAFAEDLAAHGGSPKTQVEQVCCDMNPPLSRASACTSPSSRRRKQRSKRPTLRQSSWPAPRRVSRPPKPVTCPARETRHRPSCTAPRSSSTATTWWPRPTRRSTKYAVPNRRSAPSSSELATSG